jgi:hypothetical protein
MEDRVGRCTADPAGCFPLSWTISPRALSIASGWVDWFVNQSLSTGQDYFVLPPSGHLYSYPSEFPDEVQASFVASTEDDALLLSTSGSVHWEWFGHWEHAIATYFPRYAERGVLKGFFAVNVPYNFPIAGVFDVGDDFLVVADGVVLFKPLEWRGTEYTPLKPPLSRRQYLSEAEMADYLSALPRGSAVAIYLTSDGGANLDTVYSLIPLLAPHVSVVSHEALIDLALQRGDIKT